MSYAVLWLAALVVLLGGFLALAGFDYGAGMVLPLVADREEDRRTVLNALGVFLLSNEVWLVVAFGVLGGILPGLAAILLAGAGPLLVVAVAGTVVLTVGVQLRSRLTPPATRRAFDVAICAGGAVAAFGWAAVTTRFAAGPEGGLPPVLLGGVAGVVAFAAHGAAFLIGRTDGEVARRATRLLRFLPPAAAVLVAATAVLTATGDHTAYAVPALTLATVAISVAALLAATVLPKTAWRPFLATALALAVLPAGIFAGRGTELTAGDIAGLAASHDALVAVTWTALPMLLLVLAVQVLVWRWFGGRLDARSPRFY